MAYLTGKTEQGCSTLGIFKDGYIVCAPDVPERIIRQGKTNTWHMWYAKVVGEIGEKVKIKLEWPEYDKSKVDPELLKNPNFELEWECFITCARDIVFASTDRINWNRIENVEIVGNSLVFEYELKAAESWFTVLYYYTAEMFRDLLEFSSKNEYIKTEIIGNDMGGDEIYAFTVTDFSVPDTEKKAMFFMGQQHVSENNGSHMCDLMMRFLASDDEKAAELRKKYVVYFVPVASVTSWREGLDTHLTIDINPNRDWEKMEFPTTKAIHNWLEARKPTPTFLLDIHSGLANYGRWDICQAISTNPDKNDPCYEKEHRFADLVYEECSFLPTRRYWDDFPISVTNFDGYAKRYGQAQTMEISHYAMYDREAGKHFPIDKKGLERFARQLLPICDKLISEEQK